MRGKKGWGLLAASAAAMAAAGVGAAGAAGFHQAVLRRDRSREQWEAYIESGKWKEHSEEILAGIRWFEAQEKEELTLLSRDGLRLRGSYLEAENPRACMLLCHGYHSWGPLDFSLVLRLLHDNGCSILLIDQRSHGRSQGRYIGYGVLERYDCQQWAWLLHAKLGGKLPIFLEGVSMGASTVMMASALSLPPSVVGIIADCGFNSPWDELRHCMWAWYRMPAFPVLYLIDLACRRAAGYSLRETSCAEALAKSKLPLLLIHGEADRFVPVEMTEENYAAAAGEKRKVIVPGAAHGMSYVVDPQWCAEEVLAFIQRYGGEYHGPEEA